MALKEAPSGEYGDLDSRRSKDNAEFLKTVEGIKFEANSLMEQAEKALIEAVKPFKEFDGVKGIDGIQDLLLLDDLKMTPDNIDKVVNSITREISRLVKEENKIEKKLAEDRTLTRKDVKKLNTTKKELTKRRKALVQVVDDFIGQKEDIVNGVLRKAQKEENKASRLTRMNEKLKDLDKEIAKEKDQKRLIRLNSQRERLAKRTDEVALKEQKYLDKAEAIKETQKVAIDEVATAEANLEAALKGLKIEELKEEEETEKSPPEEVDVNELAVSEKEDKNIENASDAWDRFTLNLAMDIADNLPKKGSLMSGFKQAGKEMLLRLAIFGSKSADWAFDEDGTCKLNPIQRKNLEDGSLGLKLHPETGDTMSKVEWIENEETSVTITRGVVEMFTSVLGKTEAYKLLDGGVTDETTLIDYKKIVDDMKEGKSKTNSLALVTALKEKGMKSKDKLIVFMNRHIDRISDNYGVLLTPS